jgi:citrate/tricarballylate utilization protein
VAIALAVGAARFWTATANDASEDRGSAAIMQAFRDALTLRYLDDGGAGCAYPGEAPSGARRWLHHLTFYGFVLCFAATTVAAFYENALNYTAPYPFWSAPVVLGSIGGMGLLVGPSGLLWLKRSVPAEALDEQQRPMDITFLVLLWLTAATGFLLLLLRGSAAMGLLLVLHLGVVAGLFVTVPYGKFVHGLYRTAALVRYARERGSDRTSHGS